MADKKIFITRDEYPRAYESLFRNKPHVNVSIPRKIQHVFGSNTIKRVAPNGFIKDEIRLTNKIYDYMDRVQAEAKAADEYKVARDLAQADYFIEGFIKTFMDMFSHLNPDQSSNSAHTLDLTEKTTLTLEALQTLRAGLDATAKMVRSNTKADPDKFSEKEKAFSFKYLQPDVMSWWQDLLTAAAGNQQKPVPVFQPPQPEDFWDYGRAGDPIGMWKEGNIPSRVPAEQPRPRQTTIPTMSMLEEQFLKYLDVTQKKQDTKNKILRPYRAFIEYFDDPIPSNITVQMALKFPFLQMEEFPDRKKRTLRDYYWGMNAFTRFCHTNGLMDATQKPFLGLTLPTGLGAPRQGWRPFTDEDLDKIFAYDWKPQERLLVSMALSTGCRLGELALLRWDRIQQQGNHFKYITLIDDPELFDAAVKNEGSKRLIPLNDSLQLPQRREGRVFNYSIDGYGLASTSAGRAINPILKELFNDDRKSFHSFRSTFKIKLDETGITNELSDVIMGHGSYGDNAGMFYRGMKPENRNEFIQKVELPWLTDTPIG